MSLFGFLTCVFSRRHFISSSFSLTQSSYLKDPSYKGGHGMPTAFIGNSFILSRNMLASYFSVRVKEIIRDEERDKDEMQSLLLYTVRCTVR